MEIKHYLFIITILVGSPFIIFGLYGVYKNVVVISQYNKANGVVADNISRLYADGTTAIVPVIKFKTASGEIIRYTDNVGSIPADYNEGDSVAVLYAPQNGGDARINTFKRLWFEPVLFIVIDLIPIIAGLLIARKLRV